MRRHRPALATRVTAHQALACEPHQAATRPARSMWPSAGGPTRSVASGALPHVAQGGGLQAQGGGQPARAAERPRRSSLLRASGGSQHRPRVRRACLHARAATLKAPRG